MSEKLADWTKGADAIIYQHCAACGARQYFRRSFCAACGAPDPLAKRARGKGTGGDGQLYKGRGEKRGHRAPSA